MKIIFRLLLTVLCEMFISQNIRSQNWEKINNNYPYNDSTIISIENYFSDAKVGWTIATNNSYSNIIFRTVDGGQTWLSSKIIASGNSSFKIFALDSLHCWVLRQNCYVYFTVNAGVVWDSTKIEDFIGLSASGTRIHFFNSTEGVVFAKKKWLTTDGGKTWNIMSSDTLFTSPTDIYFTTRNNGWIVGDHNPIGTHTGFISLTTDGGTTWQYQENYNVSPYTPWMIAVHFIDSTQGYAMGNNSTLTSPYIFYTTNGGTSWRRKQYLGYGDVTDIGVYNSRYLWMTSRGGNIYFSQDSGSTWTTKNIDYSVDIIKIQIINEYKKAIILTFDNITGKYSIWTTNISITVGVQRTALKNNLQANVSQNYPNPFNNNTSFQITVGEPSKSTIRIYDCVGRLVKSYSSEYNSSGTYHLSWNILDSENTLSSGLYYCVFNINGINVAHLKTVFIK